MADHLKLPEKYASSRSTTEEPSTPGRIQRREFALKQTKSLPDRQARQTPYRHRNGMLVPLSKGPDQATSPSTNTPKSNRPSSATSVLPPNVEASLTCLLAAARSFSTVMTNYDISDLTKIREVSASLKDIRDDDPSNITLYKRYLEATRDLSLSNLYQTSPDCQPDHRPSHKFSLLRASSKHHADNKAYAQLEALQYEIDQSIKKCRDDFKTLVQPTETETESRHFPTISFSPTNLSSTGASDTAKTERLGTLLLSERVPAIILGRQDFSLARKLIAIELDTVSLDYQLIIYTLKTQTKMGSVRLYEVVAPHRPLTDIDLLGLYGVSLFDLNVMRTPDMTELIELKGVGSAFAILLSEQHAVSLLSVLDKALVK